MVRLRISLMTQYCIGKMLDIFRCKLMSMTVCKYDTVLFQVPHLNLNKNSSKYLNLLIIICSIANAALVQHLR